jgi:hypothetical protein
MDKIKTMQEFKEALDKLSLDQQRVVAALFVEDVLDLTEDARIKQAQKTAADPDATPESLMSSYHSAWHAAAESSMHGDLELIDWQKQTAHFVARACSECLAPSHRDITWCHLALNVASHCRMARLCATVEHEEAQPNLSTAEAALKKQIQTQFDILSSFIQNE